MLLNILQRTGQLPTTKTCPTQNVSRAKYGSKLSIKELGQHVWIDFKRENPRNTLIIHFFL